MTPQSHTVLSDFQVRKSRRQKEAFRAWLCGELERAGYAPKVERGFAAKNVVAGDPEAAKVIFSAHYDTCAALPVPNFITPRNLLFYVCYQLLLIIPLFLAVAILEGVLLAVIVELHAPKLLLLMPVTSIALCAFFVWWILDGPANRHTANDNTSGVITLLETALALPEEERLIRVYMDMKGTQLYISCTNFTAAGKRQKTGWLFRSTKGEDHGFGLVRMDAIVERLGGYLSRNSEDGAFTTEILLPVG